MSEEIQLKVAEVGQSDAGRYKALMHDESPECPPRSKRYAFERGR